MKRHTIISLLILALLSLFGCQKSTETQLQTVEQQSTEPEASTTTTEADNKPTQTADSTESDNSAQNVHKTLQNHSFLNKFNQYHLLPAILTPDFATNLLTKNGDFAQTMKGHFVYFDINQNISATEYNSYIQNIFTHIQSNAQDHVTYSFDIKTQIRGEAISSIEVNAVDVPVQFAWQSDGKWYALYSNIKEYAPGIFAEISTSHKALYLTVVELQQ